MKKIIITCLILIVNLYSNVFSQRGNIIVAYRAKILIDTDTLKGPSNFKNVFKSSLDKADLLVYELNYWEKEQISLFLKDEKSISLVKKMDELTLDALISINGTYKQISNQFLIHEYDRQDKSLKVLVEHPIRWTITSEKRNILGYKCLKASGEILYGKKRGQFIEAWFARDLPIPAGPSIYIGLPGLVLEVREEKVILSVENIKFEENPSSAEEIHIPNKKRLLSVQEADSLLKIINNKAERFLKY